VFSLTNAAPGINSTAVVNGKNWSIQSVAQFADINHQAKFLAGGALTDVASSVVIDTHGQTALCFNTNGRLIALAATGVPGATCVAGPQVFDINKSDYNSSTAAANGDRQLRVLIAIGGQVHMCDRGRPTLSATSPDGCP
jgi:type IV fimbrial biogenesis protein FimT